ncbi:Mitochondrial import inner membrane translocase subunit TIM17-2 [Acorus gramineus]|uniref:Mitochondrial import inner membrane translocase subunit TIM17-2 n=1 Tax=Acorus gramineus TaxID=55184 RepID=A0AAV9BF24_ACOGR|nr:Mitochondrial import inner membrane translocase subunit TIM17-2 [Acorus gramineus]
MGTPETSREPCPDRILDDCGGAFAMGAVGGSIFHFLKGSYHSPHGERLIGGSQAVRMNAPRIGGSFAVWGGLFSTFDCSMVYLRQKEDPWNSIIAGAATGGFLQMRQGLGPSARSAAFGGVILALIEGAGIMLNRVLSAPQPNLPPFEEPFPSNVGIPAGIGGGGAPYATSSSRDSDKQANESSSSWFGGLFGGGKKDNRTVGSGGGGSKDEVLESFDTPSPPVPTFDYK